MTPGSKSTFGSEPGTACPDRTHRVRLDHVHIRKNIGQYPMLMLFIGALISIAAHVWLGIALFDKPVGYVDPDTLLSQRPPVRVKRADFDYVISNRPDEGEGEATERDSLADMSKKLLEEDRPPQVETHAQVLDDAALRPVEDHMAIPGPTELAIDLPAFELTQQTLSQMTTSSPRDLHFAGEGAGSGVRLESGSGSAAARQMLSQTGLVTGANPQVPSPPEVSGDKPVMDRRLLDVDLAAQPIDFARLALEDTTALNIPEKLDQDFEYTVSRYESGDFPREAGYFKVDVTALRSLHKLAAMPKDVVFLIDISGSISAEWVEQVVRGVGLALPLLNEGDRFNIVMFSETPRFFDEQNIQPVTQANIQRAGEFLTQASSGGATDVNAALSRLLVRDSQMDRVYELVLISDGKPTRGVIDTRQLINLITRDNDLRASIYCVAVGNSPNLELLNFLSYRNKGFTVEVPQFTQAGPMIQELLSRLRYPLIKNLRLHVAGDGVSKVFPLDLPNIHQGERFTIYGRYVPVPGVGVRGDQFTMQISGISAGRSVDFTFTRSFSDALHADSGLPRDWAFRKLHQLYSDMIRLGETDDLKKQVNDLRKEYKLKTLY
ncbi:MAG: VWA domain-containing protein [Phycisphaeraceae bacterium]|nr:VWA domain-containing protein [Phycisphaeraceae bacterium]